MSRRQWRFGLAGVALSCLCAAAAARAAGYSPQGIAVQFVSVAVGQLLVLAGIHVGEWVASLGDEARVSESKRRDLVRDAWAARG